MHPRQQIELVRSKISDRQQPYYNAYLQLLNYTYNASNHTTHAVVNFSIPGYYVNPALHVNRSFDLQSDGFDAYASALAYQLSGGQSKYADQSLRFLTAWAEVNKEYSDSDGPLVMTYAGTAMILAGELLSNYNGWNYTNKQEYFNWVQNVYLKAATEIRTRANNWADWGRFGSVLTAYLLDNAQEMTTSIDLIKSDLFLKIADDGHMPQETVREAHGIWYTYFSLAPMTAACWVVYQATGENLFTNYSKGNASIKHALDYLFYYNLHGREWPWYPNVTVGTPAGWPGVLFEAMSSIYNDSRYVEYVEASRPLCYNHHHYGWVFPTLMPVQLGDIKHYPEGGSVNV
ncbi:unnamed protein product [Rotaria sp. Silwood2]|nr:unnamed protein product [Rotaria sp. Silwood2]CAF2579017.1 unnamed protein product [Rotaria sp. Silwood2]CAF2826170.1 unnamed protein product [Rotaria sp. Silwood2]CAF2987218.1 unnamed protein product [Rotaria sp. Silwood2]CAF4267435.1 unnamed protein product [Rotaria sp. Silwood2]